MQKMTVDLIRKRGSVFFPKSLMFALGSILLIAGCTAPVMKPDAADLSRIKEAAVYQNTASNASSTAPQKRVMAPGTREIQVTGSYWINADCTPVPDEKILITRPPAHGSASVKLAKLYTNFNSDNQRYRCNLKPIVVPNVFYKRSPGFVGNDSLEVELFGPAGAEPVTVEYLMDAR
jgi:hypothetical protein